MARTNSARVRTRVAISMVPSRSIATAAGSWNGQRRLAVVGCTFGLDLQRTRTAVNADHHAVDAGEILAVGIDVVPAVDGRLPLVDAAAGNHVADDIGDDVIQTHGSHCGSPVQRGC